LKTGVAEWWAAAYVLLIFLVLLDDTPASVCVQQSAEVYVYGLPESPSSEIILKYFDGKSDWAVTFYGLNDSSSSERFLKMVQTFPVLSVNVLPPRTCLPCTMKHLNWADIWMLYASPLLGFFRNGRLTAITIGVTDYETLDQALIMNAEYVKVFTRYDVRTLSDEDVKVQLGKFFVGESDSPYVQPEIYHLLPLIVMAGAVDAINPCEFYVLTVFLSLIFFRVGRKVVLKAGLAFSIAVFIIYYLMGFGLLQLIAYAQEARLLVVILGFSIGLRAILNFVFGIFGLSVGLRDTIGTFFNKKLERIPGAFSKRLSAYLRRASENPATSFVIGVVATALLLPCTSGPYLIALSLISNLESLFEGLFLLTVYNSIIMTPFLAITLGLYTLKLKTGELKRWSSQKRKLLNLLAGLTMILLSVYLLCTNIL